MDPLFLSTLLCKHQNLLFLHGPAINLHLHIYKLFQPEEMENKNPYYEAIIEQAKCLTAQAKFQVPIQLMIDKTKLQRLIRWYYQ